MDIVRGDSATIKSKQALIDLTTYIAESRVTLSFVSKVVGGTDDLGTVIKLDSATSNRLYDENLGSGIRAFVQRTGEWLLITAQSGQDFTITRAQLDPGANPTIAAEIRTNDRLDIVPTDSAPASAELDPSDTTNKTVLVLIDSSHTSIPAEVYNCQIALSDGSNVISLQSSETITIGLDPNSFGVS